MTAGEERAPERVRIDKWLWAARFFKTRTLAADAVDGGKVHLNDSRVKPAREVKPGDRLEITIGDLRWTILVRALSERRGPAPDARLLYEETAESLARREAQIEERRLRAASGLALPVRARPTKRDRRRIDRFRGGE